MPSLEVTIDAKLLREYRWLMSYKSFADEALSYILETTKDEHAKDLALRALNIGANKSLWKCVNCDTNNILDNEVCQVCGL